METGGPIRARAFCLALARSLARDDSGQAITEYVLLLTLALGTAIGIAKALIAALNTATTAFGAQLEKDMKSGRANLGIWTN